MRYYVSDEPLRLREYGRNVQQMVEFAKTIEDRDARSMVVEEIVRIMHALNPSPKDTEDYRRKMWDHLFFLADFELEVDSPYPIPSEGDVLARPTTRLEYYKGKARYRQYGQNVEKMIEKAIEMEDPEKKEAYINLIANSMKQFLRNIDRYTTPEEVIAKQINELSNGGLQVKPEELDIVDVPAPPPTSYRHNKGRKKGGSKKNRRSGGSKGRRRY